MVKGRYSEIGLEWYFCAVAAKEAETRLLFFHQQFSAATPHHQRHTGQFFLSQALSLKCA